MRVLVADDLDGLLPKEISGEGARAPQGRGKGPAGPADAFSALGAIGRPADDEDAPAPFPLLPGCFPSRFRGSST
jgi:hypothetical protein